MSGLCASGGAGGGSGGGTGNTGGGSGNTISVTGSVNGAALTIKSGAARRMTYASPEVQTLEIILSEHVRTCDPAGTYALVGKGERMLAFLVQSAPDAGAVMPGMHTALLQVAATDCQQTTYGLETLSVLDFAMTASLTIDSLQGSARGSFTGTLTSGSTLSGTFDVPFCRVDPGYVNCE